MTPPEGVVALATIVMPLLMGLGVRRFDGFNRYATYSFISSTVVFASGMTGVILARQGVHLFGLFERITIGSYEVWIFMTAIKLLATPQITRLE